MMAGGTQGMGDKAARLGMVLQNLDSMHFNRGPVYSMQQMAEFSQGNRQRRQEAEDQAKRDKMMQSYLEKANNPALNEAYAMDPVGTASMIFEQKKGQYNNEIKAAEEARQRQAKQAQLAQAYEDGELTPQEMMMIDPQKAVEMMLQSQQQKRMSEAMFGPGGGQSTVPAEPAEPAMSPDSAAIPNPQTVQQPAVPQVENIRAAFGLPAAPFVTADELTRLARVYAADPKAGQSYAADLMKLAETRQQQAQFEQTQGLATDKFEYEKNKDIAAQKTENEKVTSESIQAHVSAMNVVNALDTADAALAEASLAPTSGFGASTMAMIGGTNANKLNKALATVKANSAFEVLQAMRNSSPTGGALGSISDIEMFLLQSTVANLDIEQDPAQLKANLDWYRAKYEGIVNGTLKKDIDELTNNPTDAFTLEEFSRRYGPDATSAIVKAAGAK